MDPKNAQYTKKYANYTTMPKIPKKYANYTTMLKIPKNMPNIKMHQIMTIETDQAVQNGQTIAAQNEEAP